jgi:hypothetical protein
MESAEQRDLNMFYRLVNGIRERQMNLANEHHESSVSPSFPSQQRHCDRHRIIGQAESCVAHIIHTRNTPLDKDFHVQHSHADPTPCPWIDGQSSLNATAALHHALEHSSLQGLQFCGDEEVLLPEEWSLSGYEQMPSATHGVQHEGKQSSVQQDDGDDEGIFDLDL